jgi:uncharacterized RDD family membrane protein YckC
MRQAVPVSERKPGWYPDASVPGHERWWDGGTWSHVTRQAPGQAAAAVREAAARQAAAREAAAAAGTEGFPPGGSPAPWASLPGPPGGQPGSPYAPVVTRTTPDGVPLSSPWWRLLARFLDSLILLPITMIIGFPFVRDLFAAMQSFFDEVQRATQTHGAQPGLSDLYNAPGYARGVLGLTIVQLVIGALYQIPFIALRGATPGKMAAGLRVRPWTADGHPGWARAGKRWFSREAVAQVPTLGTLYVLLDSIWLLWDPKRQCLHDKVADTVVVRTRL